MSTRHGRQYGAAGPAGIGKNLVAACENFGLKVASPDAPAHDTYLERSGTRYVFVFEPVNAET
jgi:hypothetical protein